MSNIFESILAPIQPEPVRSMIQVKLNEVLALIQENNKRVARINEAKATDPTSTEYQDAVWRRVCAAEEDAEIIAAEKRYQKAVKESDAQLKLLRELSVKHMDKPLSETEVQDLKKLVNEGKATISEAVAGAKAFAEMADTMLALTGNPVKDGVISLMPQPDSLLNSRARKSTANAGGGDKPYATRVSDITVDGKSTNKEVTSKTDKNVKENKAHFNFAAETLSRKWDSAQHKENLITAVEIEEAYYASHSKDGKPVEFREAADMPEVHEFKFTRNVVVQNANDNSTRTEPHTVVISVTRNLRVKGETETAKVETPATTETPATPAAKA
jgi:hypothetical protein